MGDYAQYIIQQIKQAGMAFGEKLDFVVHLLPQLDEMMQALAISLLVKEALLSPLSLSDLDALCEQSGALELLQRYLRGLFIEEGRDFHRMEMAARLEEVISFRIVHNKARQPELKLRQTLVEYLSHARV